MDKARELARAKRTATLWLAGAGGVFFITLMMQHQSALLAQHSFLNLIRMASEAALVGGLADWFAVSALFRPVPRKFPIPHTNIVARNKHNVARNLSAFVKEKFFNAEAIEALIRESHPATGAARWLRSPDNARRLAKYIADTTRGFLHVMEDAPIQRMLARGVKRAFGKVDMGKVAAGILTVLTRSGRHQEVLDQLISKLAAMLSHPDTQVFIAQKLAMWMKTEHRRLEKLLPSGWLSEQGAAIAISAMASILKDIDEDPSHPVREAFNKQIQRYIEQIHTDPTYAARFNEAKWQLLSNDKLAEYLVAMWGDVRRWLESDLARPEGRVQSGLANTLVRLGKSVAEDEQLAQAIDTHIGEAGRYMAPELADFLTDHIRQTIENWDESDMANQIELNIGKDLQRVRINGTLVGGLIGAGIFVIESTIARFL